jgi:hypothetical protein
MRQDAIDYAAAQRGASDRELDEPAPSRVDEPEESLDTARLQPVPDRRSGRRAKGDLNRRADANAEGDERGKGNILFAALEAAHR